MPIVRKNHGRGHTYTDTDTGAKLPGVTTINRKGIPKAALEEWKVKATVDYWLDHRAELADLPPSEGRQRLLKARYTQRDEGSVRGTQVHNLGARIVAGETVKIPDGLVGYVNSYVRFIDEFDVVPVIVERTIVHRRLRYSGTLDLIADLVDPFDPEPDFDLARRDRWLLDLATNASGVFPERAVQLAGYRYAESWVDEDGVENDMPEVDRTGVVWITPDFYQLIPVDAEPEQFEVFVAAITTARFTDDGFETIGDPIIPPYTSQWSLRREPGGSMLDVEPDPLAEADPLAATEPTPEPATDPAPEVTSDDHDQPAPVG
jgi:hypothetical protein